MIDDQLGDNAYVPFMGLLQKSFEVAQRAVILVNRIVIGDVIAVVPER